MKHEFPFTWLSIRKEYEEILGHGYRIVTCSEYVELKGHNPEAKSTHAGRILVNRVDIDQSCKKARRLAIMFNELNIRATFFVRLHADDYNPFSFENYRCLRFIRDSGHEIGYHSEVIDQSAIWDEDPAQCLRRDIQVLNKILGIKVKGAASHGGRTGLNNLDFWKDKKPDDFGLLYEAYDRTPEFNLFHDSLYVSDSSWTYWKCFYRGKEMAGDHRTPSEHLEDSPPLVYLLIHPDTYYDEYFYE